MRRTFWAEVFANPAVEDTAAGSEGGPANSGGSAVVLASFPGQQGQDCVMAPATAMTAAGSEVYWMAQEIGGWLSMLLARDQRADAVGLENVWLRAQGSSELKAPGSGPLPWCGVSRVC
jgi:hypothetical protein